MLTPVLLSPDREDGRRWLRIDATANLPDGTALEVLWAATDDEVVRDRLESMTNDASIPASQRVARLLAEPELQFGRTVFRADIKAQHLKTFSAKLFDVTKQYLWVTITLTAATDSRLPVLAELHVVYPGRTLMEDLPAIYRREEFQPNNFLRALVGVIETTTHGLDARIGAMGSRIHPSTAQGPWLDFVARWLGVPWDDSLPITQKRAIVMRAAELADGRGTRAGLEALLECLLPGSPIRFRVTDVTADFGFAVLGDKSCAGSKLPAMLAGRARCGVELDFNTIIGTSRLPCSAQQDDSMWQLVGKVRIDVVATATERKELEQWLLPLITEMVPLTASVQLRWVTAQSMRSDRLDGMLTLESLPTPHLGTDAVTGQAILPERGPRLSATGPTIETHLF